MFIAYTICDGKAHGVFEPSRISDLGVGETMGEAILNCQENMPIAVCPASAGLVRAVQNRYYEGKWSVYDGVARLDWENDARKRFMCEWEKEWEKEFQAEGGV